MRQAGRVPVRRSTSQDRVLDGSPSGRRSRVGLTSRALSLGLLAGVPSAAPLRAQPHATELSAEVYTGGAWSLPLPFTVALPGAPAARLRPHWSTRPFADAPYYAYRAGWARDARGVDAELLHHKLYLENPAPPVERFEVTHGYNLPMLSARAPAGGWQLRIGLGAVIAHAEGRIAGRAVGGGRTLLGGGYHIAGVAAQVAVGRRYLLGRGATALFAAPELKLTAARARVPLDGGGTVTVPNVAVHLLGGLGVRHQP